MLPSDSCSCLLPHSVGSCRLCSELVRHPRGNKVDVLSWTALPQERAGKEVRVVRREGDVPTRFPLRFHRRGAPDISGMTVLARAHEIYRVAIDTIPHTVAPEEVPVCGD